MTEWLVPSRCFATCFLWLWCLSLGACAIKGPPEGYLKNGDGKDKNNPTVVEAEPGDLVVTQPARASFIPLGEKVMVVGSGATQELTVDGKPIPVQSDGSFQVEVKPGVGLNIIRLQDGPSALEVPYLYGNFSPPEAIVPAAARLRVNAQGFDSSSDSDLSLAGLARSYLQEADLTNALLGQKFEGNVTLASYRFDVKNASYGDVRVKLKPHKGGARFEAEVDKVYVGGKLKVSALFSWTDAVALKAKRITISGKLKASFKDKKIEAETDDIDTKMDGFQYDSNNAGFPCCVDDIVTSILRPIVENELEKAVEDHTREGFSFALNQIGLPSLIDLNPAAGQPLPIVAQVALSSELDDAVFDDKGLTLSLAGNFQAPATATVVHGQAPGWLQLGKAPALMASDSPFGIAISLDTLNQALFAIWVQGGLELKLGDTNGLSDLSLSAQLPPVFSVQQEGKVRAGIGEVILRGGFNGKTIQAAISIVDDVALKLDAKTQKLGLAMSPAPLISFTWLDEGGLPESLRTVLRTVVIEQVPQLLAPLSIPLPTLPLGGISSAYANQSAVMGPTIEVKVQVSDQRVKLLGRMIVADSP